MKKMLFGLLLLVLVFGMVGCGGGGGGGYAWNSNIYIYNNSFWTLDIYMDGAYYFSLAGGSWNFISNVPPGVHYLEAYEVGCGCYYDSVTLETYDFTDYSWNIYTY